VNQAIHRQLLGEAKFRLRTQRVAIDATSESGISVRVNAE
jgi:hypothetical protein